MFRSFILPIGAALIIAGQVGALADATTGLTCRISADSLNMGGGRMTNSDVRMESNVGDWEGIVADGSANNLAKTGYIGTLTEIVSLVVNASPPNVAENGTSDLTATGIHDDDTFGPTAPGWSVLSGPISSVTTAGLAYASAVYQDTFATVLAVSPDASGVVQFVVLDTLKDNYGFYAGDEVMDSWQVQYFGLSNSDALGSVDADDDGQINQIEFMAGTVPTNPASLFEVAIEKGSATDRMDVVLYPAFTDRAYSLQTRTNLLAGDWETVADMTEFTNGLERIITDLGATNQVQFYRAQIRYDWE
jgi:hypothetical protein